MFNILPGIAFVIRGKPQKIPMNSSLGLLSCDAAQCCGRITPFRRTTLPPSSGRRRRQRSPPLWKFLISHLAQWR